MRIWNDIIFNRFYHHLYQSLNIIILVAFNLKSNIKNIENPKNNIENLLCQKNNIENLSCRTT